MNMKKILLLLISFTLPTVAESVSLDTTNVDKAVSAVQETSSSMVVTAAKTVANKMKDGVSFSSSKVQSMIEPSKEYMTELVLGISLSLYMAYLTYQMNKEISKEEKSENSDL